MRLGHILDAETCNQMPLFEYLSIQQWMLNPMSLSLSNVPQILHWSFRDRLLSTPSSTSLIRSFLTSSRHVIARLLSNNDHSRIYSTLVSYMRVPLALLLSFQDKQVSEK